MIDALPQDILMHIGLLLGKTDRYTPWQEPLTAARGAAVCMMASPALHPIGLSAYDRLLRACYMKNRGSLPPAQASAVELKAATSRYGLRYHTKAQAWAALLEHHRPLCPVPPDDRYRLRREFGRAADGYLVSNACNPSLPAMQAACLRTFGDIGSWQLAADAAVAGREQRRQHLAAVQQELQQSRIVQCTQYQDYILWGIGEAEEVATYMAEEWFFRSCFGAAFNRYRGRLIQRRTPWDVLDATAREHVVWSLVLERGPAQLARHPEVPHTLRDRLLRGDFDIWPGGRGVHCETAAP